MSENISNLTKELEQSKTREHLLSDELRILQVLKSHSIFLYDALIEWLTMTL